MKEKKNAIDWQRRSEESQIIFTDHIKLLYNMLKTLKTPLHPHYPVFTYFLHSRAGHSMKRRYPVGLTTVRVVMTVCKCTRNGHVIHNSTQICKNDTFRMPNKELLATLNSLVFVSDMY